jgi:hypothetical protein
LRIEKLIYLSQYNKMLTEGDTNRSTLKAVILEARLKNLEYLSKLMLIKNLVQIFSS